MSRCSVETDEGIELIFVTVASFHLSFVELKGNSRIFKNKGKPISPWNFVSKLIPSHSQTILYSKNDQLYASNMTNTGHKASSHMMGLCTQSAFTISDTIAGARSVMGVFSASPEIQWTPPIRPFTTVSQQLLIAVEHAADDILGFSRTVHWHIIRVTQSTRWRVIQLLFS